MKTDPVKNDSPLKMIDGSAVMNITTAMTPRMNIGTTDATPLITRSTRSPAVSSVLLTRWRARPASTLPAVALLIAMGWGFGYLTGDRADLRLDGGEHGCWNGGLETYEVLFGEECRG